MNPNAIIHHATLNEHLTWLDRCDYSPDGRAAVKDWYRNERIWRPVTAEKYDDHLNALPPVLMQSHDFIGGEPHTHDRKNRPVYYCYRYFAGIPHLMLATVDEFLHEKFPCLSATPG